jgi:hypothetical protein
LLALHLAEVQGQRRLAGEPARVERVGGNGPIALTTIIGPCSINIDRTGPPARA